MVDLLPTQKEAQCASALACSPAALLPCSPAALLLCSRAPLLPQSLQIAAFLFTVCHVVIVVQDWFTDLSLYR